MEAAATLIAHTDTNIVTRAQLAALPAVVCTDSFKPIPHIELIESLEKALSNRSISIGSEQFSIKADGSKLFGTLKLGLNGIPGSCAALGLRTANDKSMSIQMIAGMAIFVCDNMAFNGDMVCVKRRHTSGLDLKAELDAAVAKYEQHYFNLKAEVENLKAAMLTDEQAKAMIYDMFDPNKNLHPMPSKYFTEVGREYFNPKHAEFEPRTMWSLHNAFTEIQKDRPLHLRMAETQEVGRLFGLVGQKNLMN
jgi:hypothetical protein